MKFNKTITKYEHYNDKLRYKIEICKHFTPDEINPDFAKDSIYSSYTWNVYVEFFNDCKVFNKLKEYLEANGEKASWTRDRIIYYDVISYIFPFEWHGGCTYTEFTENGLKIGNDYAHLGDEYIENSKDLPKEVLCEAEKLDKFVKGFIEENEK